MKIGILTFHAQLNYGGVLQCWALQTALEGLGHEAVVVDRWITEDHMHLVGERRKFGRLKDVVNGALGRGTWGVGLRRRRTQRFLEERLKLTPYHFCDWADAPVELGVDGLVVGSDQVWRCEGGSEPGAYLLEGAPEGVRALAYAASFGMPRIPAEREAEYRRGLARFAALSCREAEGVDLCRGLGFESTHVADPTLLLDDGAWRRLAGGERKERKLFCYFLQEDVAAALPQLAAFARERESTVQVLVHSFRYPPFTWREPAGVHVDFAAGPEEFLRGLSEATWVLSDSFHALMFSALFGKDIRILRPENEGRKAMFARIDEFRRTATRGGELLADSVGAALASLGREEAVQYVPGELEVRRADSLHWLEDNLKRLCGGIPPPQT